MKAQAQRSGRAIGARRARHEGGRRRPLAVAAHLAVAGLCVAGTRLLLTLRGLDATLNAAARVTRHGARKFQEPADARGPIHDERIHDERVVAWSVAAASRLVPGANCLTQALAGQLLLARRGRASRIRIGVRPGPNGALLAHAWLLSGSRVLLGGADTLAAHRTIRTIDWPPHGPCEREPGPRSATGETA